ncbi:Zinc finger protein basonuclin-2 [Larimichthys crocea]|uniref:Zinc finger protein basonuclin-2 n=1 Tax=Larimichthys crocea TaxID=215358 RepID=A0A6G0HKA3_LARCR|nr:Zinc finger protein basonuclin-2 [Larimichthys crocea]
MRMTPDSEESIRCTVSSCSCVCFKPGGVQLRSCDCCGHGWVAHALEKLHFQAQQPSSCCPAEVALPGLVFDLSSLVLYGAQAVPVRIKILLDRLYSVLTPEQVSDILHTLGWSLGDYVRGYMLQWEGVGPLVDGDPEEELLILKQFFRFGETRPIVELMTLQCLAGDNYLSDPELNPTPKSCRSNAGMFFGRNGGTTPGSLRKARGDSHLEAGVCRFKRDGPADHNDADHHFENFPGGQSLLLPFHFPSSAIRHSVPPTKELPPPSKITQCLRKPTGTKLVERYRHEGQRRDQEADQKSDRLKIKADPDKPNPALSTWHQNHKLDLDLHRSMANTSSLAPALNPSLIPTSSPQHPSTSSSLKISQKFQGSSSYSFNPFPSSSCSFLCPLPTSSSFSSSLHPLPSSLCSLPPPAGGRKGRVCCGVCGKSFYDKGTLKIHYNAVHLKIKHCCTVAGCTMVFSSLRSRNRHSANPNPRLHTGASRDAHTTHRNTHCETQIHKDKRASENMHDTEPREFREKEISNTLWRQEDDSPVCVHSLKNELNGHANPQHGCRDNTPAQADSPPPTLSQDANQNFTLSDSTSRSDPQALPPTPLLPACSTSSLGSPPSLVPLVIPEVERTESRRHPLRLHADRPAPARFPGPTPVTMATCNSQPMSRDYCAIEGKHGEALTNQLQMWWESGDLAPKKKSRKSSMPVKIEREKEEGMNEEEECRRP